jgi:hypothetical protein
VMVLGPLRKALITKIDAAKLSTVAKIESQALLAIVWMSQHGVRLDKASWQSLAAAAGEEASRFEQELNQLVPRPSGGALFGGFWNWDSPLQAQKALALAGCTIKNTADETLAATDHPMADLLRRYRLAKKRGST